ncbi:protein DPCD [Teleopsis dalmanni]|uniref:protein DPCD n=1 Tax=Teleopsis dalmanni TaxID=139649 RepID=UPI0018CF07C4|nr:protein DPCD [Teleopsis dalmanni]
MSYQFWIDYLNAAKKTSFISGKCRKILYEFPDGKTMAEEYSLDTGIVQRRSWKKCKQLTGEPEWEMEIGEIPRQIGQINKNSTTVSDFILRESDSQPELSKRVTKKCIEWRIRCLPYPASVYVVKVNAEKRTIVVSTTNKKYYKVIPMLELDRCGLQPKQENLEWHHQYNTLIITYKKPDLVMEMDAQVLMLLKNVETEGDVSDLLQELLT